MRADVLTAAPLLFSAKCEIMRWANYFIYSSQEAASCNQLTDAPKGCPRTFSSRQSHPPQCPSLPAIFKESREWQESRPTRREGPHSNNN